MIYMFNKKLSPEMESFRNYLKQKQEINSMSKRGTFEKLLKTILGIFLLFLLIIIMATLMSGCALFQPTPTVESIIPTSGWESTMKTLAKSDWIITFCLLAFFSGVVTVALDVKKIGISIILASIMTLFLGLAVHRFPTWMAVIGFIGSAITCLVVVLKRKKALVEIIRGVQNYRNSTGISKSLNQSLLVAESISTKKTVKEVKKSNNIS